MFRCGSTHSAHSLLTTRSHLSKGEHRQKKSLVWTKDYRGSARLRNATKTRPVALVNFVQRYLPVIYLHYPWLWVCQMHIEFPDDHLCTPSLPCHPGTRVSRKNINIPTQQKDSRVSGGQNHQVSKWDWYIWIHGGTSVDTRGTSVDTRGYVRICMGNLTLNSLVYVSLCPLGNSTTLPPSTVILSTVPSVKTHSSAPEVYRYFTVWSGKMISFVPSG